MTRRNANANENAKVNPSAALLRVYAESYGHFMRGLDENRSKARDKAMRAYKMYKHAANDYDRMSKESGVKPEEARYLLKRRDDCLVLAECHRIQWHKLRAIVSAIREGELP